MQTVSALNRLNTWMNINNGSFIKISFDIKGSSRCGLHKFMCVTNFYVIIKTKKMQSVHSV